MEIIKKHRQIALPNVFERSFDFGETGKSLEVYQEIQSFLEKVNKVGGVLNKDFTYNIEFPQTLSDEDFLELKNKFKEDIKNIEIHFEQQIQDIIIPSDF